MTNTTKEALATLSTTYCAWKVAFADATANPSDSASAAAVAAYDDYCEAQADYSAAEWAENHAWAFPE